MAWRTEPLPRGWARTQARILRRDRYRCQQRAVPDASDCLIRATEVDHVIPAAQGGTDDDDNLQALCKPCHKAKTEAERRRSVAVRQRAKRRPEPHPGGRPPLPPAS